MRWTPTHVYRPLVDTMDNVVFWTAFATFGLSTCLVNEEVKCKKVNFLHAQRHEIGPMDITCKISLGNYDQRARTFPPCVNILKQA